jgi:hypothetical protein
MEAICAPARSGAAAAKSAAAEGKDGEFTTLSAQNISGMRLREHGHPLTDRVSRIPLS